MIITALIAAAFFVKAKKNKEDGLQVDLAEENESKKNRDDLQRVGV